MTIIRPEPPASGTALPPTRFLPLGEDENPGLKPIDPNDPDVKKLLLIELALKRGMPWAMIARAIGVPDKRAAKRMRDQLARRVKLKQAGVIG